MKIARSLPSRGAALLAVLLVLLAACATTKPREKLLTETLRTYAAAIRWGSIEQAESFIDPAYREHHPLTTLELERYRQIRFTQYNERAPVPVSDVEVRQVVEIAVVNLNTQSMRTILDQQVWKYNADQKRWLLASGLPDITRRD